MKVYVDHEVETYRWDSGLANYIDLMKQNNIEIVNNLAEAELFCFILDSRTMFNELSKTKQNNLLNFKGPIVILERVDSAVCWFRDFDKLPNAVVFKNRIMRPASLQNEIMYYGRYHYKLVHDLCHKELANMRENQKDISKDWGLKALKPIAETDLSKVRAVNWDFHSSFLSKRMQPYLTLSNQPKIYDVFCVNRDKDGIQGFYRKKAKDIVNKMSKLKILTKPIPKDKYPKMLASSKIAVSVWGHGETTHLDNYAWYSKVLLIKPESGHVLSNPDFYQNGKTYLACKADFSDLTDIINNILNEPHKYNEIVEYAYKLQIKNTRESMVINFINELKSVFKEYKDNR